MDTKTQKKAFGLLLIAIALTALAGGLSEGLYSNFYFEVYDVSAAQRGFIEFPREIPGLIAVVIISLFAFMGEIRLAIVAQILSIIGLVLLGVFTPPFSIMLIFLFVNSMGMHLYMPLKDSISLKIIGSENTGQKFGVVNSVRTATAFVVGIIIFFGFRSGIFHFEGRVVHIFLIATLFFVGVVFILLKIRKLIGDPPINTGKGRFLFRREYKFYYILASLHGAHKQIAGVFGPWVLIEILLRQADTMAILGMIGSFLGIFFIPMAGRLADRWGVRTMMFVEGFSFIFIYVAFGVVSGGLSSGMLAVVGIPVILVYILFIFDRMTMQLGMIRTLYLRTIALDPSEISPTLSTGMSIDHVISIVGALLGGLAWAAWGPQYVFYIAAALSMGNVLVAACLPKKEIKNTRTSE
ncbi:MAG: MFS transporter [Defluviitaleaceae bacterium]|nr:MFS transporter [Defluviitaleaceae bacterium]